MELLGSLHLLKILGTKTCEKIAQDRLGLQSNAFCLVVWLSPPLRIGLV